ncbi:MAG: hypothetical protein AMXMBFR44_5610 [Candidatus Campbellbacteria bacterium]
MNIEKVREATQQAQLVKKVEERWRMWCAGNQGRRDSIQHPNSPLFHHSNLPEDVQEDIRDLEAFLRSEEAQAAAELLGTAGKMVFLCDVSGGCPIYFCGQGLWEQVWSRPANPAQTTALFRREYNVSIVEFIRRFVDMVADSLLPLPVTAR